MFLKCDPAKTKIIECNPISFVAVLALMQNILSVMKCACFLCMSQPVDQLFSQSDFM